MGARRLDRISKPNTAKPIMITPSISSAVSMAAVAAAKASTTSGSSGAVGGGIIGSEICVIGAGAAGLVTARHLIRCGLRPTLFDTALDVGGLWNSNKRHSSGNGKNSINNNNNGKTWNSLRTNLSRYTCSFSDYPWSLVPNKKGTSNDKVNSVENEEGDALSFFFPTADQVHEYLQSYSNQYLKDHCIFHLGCEVSKVTRAPDNQGYVIEWRKPTNQQPPQQEDQGQQQEVVHRKVFGGVVVASGFFSKPAWPTGADLTAFPGTHLHSSQYRSFHDLGKANKSHGATTSKVAVCGSSFSALEIAADLAKSSSSSTTSSADTPPHIISILPSVPWIFPRFVPDRKREHSFSPLDIVFYQRTSDGLKMEETLVNDPTINTRKHETLAQLLGTRQKQKVSISVGTITTGTSTRAQGSSLSLASSPSSPQPKDQLQQPWDDPTLPVFSSVSDDYLELVHSGRIQVQRGHLVGCSEHGELQIETPAAESNDKTPNATKTTTTTLISGVDTLISATGYYTNVNFLDDSILQALDYEPENKFMPLLLCDDVYHPQLPGLVFVGMYRGPYFGVMELQARLAVAKLQRHLATQTANRDDMTKSEDNQAGVGTGEGGEADDVVSLNVAKQIREKQPQPQFPREDLIGRMDTLVSKLRRVCSHPTPPTQKEGQIVELDHGLGDAPHFCAKGDLVLPVMYQPDLALAQSVLKDLEDNLKLRCQKRPHHVTSVLLKSLVGRWKFQRTLTPVGTKDATGIQVGSSQSVSGTIQFSLLQQTSGQSNQSDTKEKDEEKTTTSVDEEFLLYREDGVMMLPTGKPMEVFREYHYVKNEDTGAMELFFVEDGKRAHQFLNLLFEAQSIQPDSSSHTKIDDGIVVWTARSNHLCVKDMYNAQFRIELNGLAAQSVQMEYTVKGPSKDYVARTILTPTLV